VSRCLGETASLKIPHFDMNLVASLNLIILPQFDGCPIASSCVHLGVDFAFSPKFISFAGAKKAPMNSFWVFILEGQKDILHVPPNT